MIFNPHLLLLFLFFQIFLGLYQITANISHGVLVITCIWCYLPKCCALFAGLSKPFDSLLFDSLLAKLNRNWFKVRNTDKQNVLEPV